ncbi:MAG: hypothetical protein HZA91_13655 [Verrucomicrobia bacterium]|nr:hypothetical protein [Verrucomicrobiota bacterium]
MMVPTQESGPPMGATRFAPPAYVAGLRSYAHEAAKEAGCLLDAAKRVPVRGKEQGDALASVRALQNSAKQYVNATVSAYWPRPDWLRHCSENLLDSWMRVDQSLPMLHAPPPVMECWGRAQAAMVALYNAVPPMDKPSGRPLPLALGSGADVPASGAPPAFQPPVQNVSVWDKTHLTGPEAKELGRARRLGDVKVSGEQPKDEAPAPEPQEHKETAINPDGSRTTTTTRTDPGGNITVTSTTEYSDDTTRTVTTVKFTSGATTTQTVGRDGSSTTTHTTTDENGTQITTINTTDKETGIKTDTWIGVGTDRSKTTKTMTTDKDGGTTRSRETVNSDGSKETSKKNPDGSWTWSFTDKDGNTATTSGDGKGGKITGKTGKGTYTEEKQPDGSVLVSWDVPSGSGGATSFPKGTNISPNTGEGPLPFKVDPPKP